MINEEIRYGTNVEKELHFIKQKIMEYFSHVMGGRGVHSFQTGLAEANRGKTQTFLSGRLTLVVWQKYIRIPGPKTPNAPNI